MSMPTILQRAAGVSAALAATAALGLAAAGPAAADTQKHQDPRGDVKSVEVRQAPKPGIDIVGLKNTYQGKKLTLSLTMANLLKKGYGAEWFITTADSTYVLVFDHTNAQPTVQFQNIGTFPRHAVGLQRLGGETCNGVKAKAKDDTVVATVPRSCIGGENEVRIAGLTLLPSETFKIDDSRQKGFDPMGGDIKFGPKLKRN